MFIKSIHDSLLAALIAMSVVAAGIIFYEYTTQTLDYTHDSFSQVKEQK